MAAVLSLQMFQVLHFSKEEAVRTGYDSVSTDHLLLGVLRSNDSLFQSLMKKFGIEPSSLKEYLDSRLISSEAVNYRDPSGLAVDENARNVLRMSFYEASIKRHREVTSLDLLVAILKDGESFGASFFRERMITASGISEEMGTKPVSYTPQARRELLN